jgi:DNA repair ATPase RecN
MSESCEVCETKLGLVTADLDITNILLEELQAEQKDEYMRTMDRKLRTIESLNEKLGAKLRAINERHAKCEDNKNELTRSITSLKSTITSLENANDKLDKENRILTSLHMECTGTLEVCSEREAMCLSCGECEARGNT